MLHVNDEICLLDSVGGGRVKQVDTDKNMVWIETDDGFDIGPIPMSQCVPVGTQGDYMHHHSRTISSKNVISQPTAAPVSDHSHGRVTHRSQRKSNELVFDLHMDALPTNGSGMTEAERHQYQLQYFRMQMQQNIRYRGKKLVFIHGKGNGVLKNEIRQELRRNYKDQVEVRDADFAMYEEGATMVIIK